MLAARPLPSTSRSAKPLVAPRILITAPFGDAIQLLFWIKIADRNGFSDGVTQKIST